MVCRATTNSELRAPILSRLRSSNASNPNPCHDHHRDRSGLCGMSSGCRVDHHGPTDCFHHARHDLRVLFDCMSGCWTSPQACRCTAPCCCRLLSAWAQSPVSHQRQCRCFLSVLSGVYEEPELSVASSLQVLGKRGALVRRPADNCQPL